MSQAQFTPQMITLMRELLNRGSRVELAIEKGQISIIEIRRKKRDADPAETPPKRQRNAKTRNGGPGKPNGAVS